MSNPNNAKYATRKYIIVVAMVLVGLLYIGRLFYLQVLSPEYKVASDNIAFYNKTLYPSRGLIYDNEGRLVVYNKVTANIQIITREMASFDTLQFCQTFGISREDLLTRLRDVKDPKKNRGYSSYTPQLLLTQVSQEEAGRFEEMLYKYPGFYVERSTSRDYHYHSAGLLLGNVAEVSRYEVEQDDYYVPRDHIGKTGIEKSYERFLRGKKGKSVLLRDAHGRIQGQYGSGTLDEELTSGHDLYLAIDMELQSYGEELMKGMRGAIVMIEPKTGEIRALVTSPSFDPSMLYGKNRGNNFKALEADPNKPLFNRAIMGTYPPGSTFKMASLATYLQDGAITPEQAFPCHRGYPILGGRPACHGHMNPISATDAIAQSCNAYFCWGLRAMIDDRSHHSTTQEAFDIWRDDMVAMGFGYALGVDMPNESRGFIPNANLYDKIYNKRWSSSNVISISIGQGEILTTPLQLANLGALIANRGHYYTPHVVKEIAGLPQDSLYIERHETSIESRHFDVIDEGMRRAVTGGTCRRANLPNIKVCGKTGTSENVHGKDHSLFLGYAPQEDPQIAIAVIVENAGFGATFALPIGRLMIERYLSDEPMTPESVMYEQMMLQTYLH